MSRKVMMWALERLREPSTWRGLAAIATALGVALAPEQIEAVVALGLLIIGMINMVRKENRPAKRHGPRVLPVLVALSLLPAAAQAYDGTISAAGYQPPPNVTVYWRTFSGGDILRKLNRDVSWSGSNSDAAGYLGRYAEGKTDVLGRWIASQGVETQGGMAFLILRELYREAGITRDPNAREVLDFGIVHGGQRQLGCADFARLAGRPDPSCKEAVLDGGLRPQPSTPAGCCKKTLPCEVDDRRKPGTVWQEAVRTPQGGRKGCYMVQPAVPGGGDDPPGDDTPVDPIDPQPAAAVCLLVRMMGETYVTTKVVCP